MYTLIKYSDIYTILKGRELGYRLSGEGCRCLDGRQGAPRDLCQANVAQIINLVLTCIGKVVLDKLSTSVLPVLRSFLSQFSSFALSHVYLCDITQDIGSESRGDMVSYLLYPPVRHPNVKKKVGAWHVGVK